MHSRKIDDITHYMKEQKTNDNKVQLIRVRFPGQSMPGTFLAGNLPLKHGDQVVAMSERGLAVGFINSYPFEMPYEKSMEKIPTIIRAATSEDLEKYKNVYQEQRKAKNIFTALTNELQLPMELVDMKFTSCGKKVEFYFISPQRVDFRELLKVLVKELKCKIELVQVSEAAHSVQSVGPCGPEICSFVNSLMKENKKCNEYNCCLDYKDPFYEDKKAHLPKVGKLIQTHTGECGKVERVDLVKEEFEMLTDQGVLKRYTSNLFKSTLNPKEVSFPKRFDFISNETRVVLGKEELEKKKEMILSQEQQKYKTLGKEFAEKNFEKLFE